MRNGQEEFDQASLTDIGKEMAIPRMAKSVRDGISQQNQRLNQPRSSKKERSYATLSDLGGVVARIEKFATRRTIFSQGDIAETVMYIQRGRVELSVASKTDKDAVVAILGPGNFFLVKPAW